MKKITLALVFVFFCFPCVLVAQKQKEHPKGSYVDSLNRYYQQVDLPVYIFIGTTPTGTPTQLKEAAEPNKPIYLDGPGAHNLRHVDALNQRVHNFPVYADGMAPKTAVTFSGAPVFQSTNKTFYGKGLAVHVKAADDMSGLNATYCSMNGADYASCTPTTSVSQQGNYALKFYSVDNVGNVENTQEKLFTVDTNAPKTYYEIVGITTEKVISLASLVSLKAIDSISGVATTYYSFDGEPMKRYAGGLIPLTGLANGEHTIRYYSVDNVSNQEAPDAFTFSLDRTAPIMSADVLGDRFIVDDRVYFSGKTKMKLTAIDNISGVKEIKYSINDGPFETYTDPFYLPGKSGKYVVRYYAIDKMGNTSSEDKVSHTSGVVYVDLTGPVISNSFVGTTFEKGDVVYVNNKVDYKFTAVDSESGLQRIAYILDNGNEQPYKGSLSSPSNGDHSIEIIAYDNVNNRNVRAIKIFVDNDGPEIGYSFSTVPSATNSKGIEVYPSYITLFLNASDNATTVSSLSYIINDGKEQAYTSPIKGFEKNKTYNVTIRTKDALGNESTKKFVFETNNL